MKAKNENTKYVPFIVLVLAFFVVAALLAYNRYLNPTYGDMNVVGIPSITSSLKSSGDGKEHTFKVEFYVEFPEKDNVPSKDLIHGGMQTVVAEMDYGKINQTAGYDYVKENIESFLSSNSIDYTDIYITTLQADNAIISDSPKFKNDRQEQAFKSLFPSMK